MNSRYADMLSRVLSVPTAPFREQAVISRVRAWAKEIRLDVRADAAGNLFLHYRRGRTGTRWIFAAHMDHPGFVAGSRSDKPPRPGAIIRPVKSIGATFTGGVADEYFPGAKVRFFAPDGEFVGRIQTAEPAADNFGKLCQVVFPKPVPVCPGCVGMWDLPALELRDGRIVSRACDDVVGCASVLCALDELRRRKVAADVTVLLTRAEEAAFVGALAACRAGSIDRRAAIVAIETSQAQPAAPIGGGVVVRVGDKAWTFDPALTGHVSDVAATLAAKDAAFRYVRQLMPGGTCESTAYGAFGYQATGLCVPLGNYHNQGRRNKIAAEEVSQGDFECLVKLLVAIAADGKGPADATRALKARMTTLIRTRGKWLK